MNDIPQHDDLPLPDYDHLPVGVLGSKITGLDESGLQQLLAYERAHGDRLPVVQVLERRLEALRQGAEPSGPVPTDAPEVSSSSQGSPVSPETSGPPINPPSQGTPFNPAQPR
ncbi:hypothetical protein [Kocuria oceani]|uniref:DUF8129 domain-containing protein n=1 Tax=Kocuria oceani TaxID=988827 RepID=A0ABV9TP92_9MICC|nr:hypothetical protein [Kocuria oceani]